MVRFSDLTSVFILSTILHHISLNLLHFSLLHYWNFISSEYWVSSVQLSLFSLLSPPLPFTSPYFPLPFALSLSSPPHFCLCLSLYFILSPGLICYIFLDDAWTQMLYVFINVLIVLKIVAASFSELYYTLMSLVVIKKIFQDISRPNLVTCFHFPLMLHETNAKKYCIQFFAKGGIYQYSEKSMQG